MLDFKTAFDTISTSYILIVFERIKLWRVLHRYSGILMIAEKRVTPNGGHTSLNFSNDQRL